MVGRRRIGWWPLVVVLVLVAVAAVIVVNRRQAEHPATGPADGSSLLALTWAPSLCSVDSSVRGCRTGNVGRKGQTFLLHGLWPQPSTAQYCGIGKDKQPPQLPADIRERLAKVMSDASVLAPHEWLAHGTCSGVTPTDYFSVAMTLAAQATEVLDPAVRSAQGRGLSVTTLRELFDSRFGPGAGSRLTLNCRRAEGSGDVVYEVRLSLPSVVTLRAAGASLSLADQLAKAPTLPPGCRQAQVP